MVALNKKFPKIPMIHEYRPIVVLSSVVKFLEGYIADSLRQYTLKKLNVRQFGFIPGMSIDECKEAFLSEVSRRLEIKEQTTVIFFDLKSAYDRVDRRILIEII
jgi:hypothetical protein